MTSNSVKTFHMIQLAKLIQNTDVKLGLGKEHQSWSKAEFPVQSPSTHTITINY